MPFKNKQTYENYYKDYYQKNKERISKLRKERYRAISKRFYEKAKLEQRTLTYTPQWKMWYGAKWRSEKYGIPFNLELEDIIIPEKCPILGIEFNLNSTDKSKQSCPSLDKIIPELGYIKGNIRVISLRANSMKSNITLEIAERLVRYMKGEI